MPPHVQEYVSTFAKASADRPGTSLPRALLEAFLIILLFSVIPLVLEISVLERYENSFSAAC